MIYTPLFVGVAQDDEIASATEKRNLARLPSTPSSIKELANYPSKFNDYYSDNFGFREKLTKKYFSLINELGNPSSIDDVTFGRDGWLFLGSIKPGYTGYEDPMGDAMNTNLFSDEELEEFARSLTAVNNWLKERGIKYIYVIAPNKHTIYFEKLPEYIQKQNKYSSTDQLVKYLRENTDVVVVDLRQALFEKKDKYQLFFKTDTHWNYYGGNIAQFEIMKAVKYFFPEKISPSLLDDSQFKASTTAGGDLAGFANLENITEDDPQPVFLDSCTPTKETPAAQEIETHTMICNTRELNAIIFQDSFFPALKPFISRQFFRSTYIWKRMDYDELNKYVEKEKPDIVIDEIVERTLPYIPMKHTYQNFYSR